MVILLTGSKGFIGKALLKKLHEQNYSVVEFTGDITEEESYAKLNDVKIDHCIHLAAKSFVPESWNNPAYFIKNNVYGTERVLEFCRAKNISLTFMSSYLYGTPQVLPINEQHPLQTPNPYALSKFLAEELCRFYAEYYKIKITVLRPFNTYGPGQDKRFLIPMLIDQFLGTEQEIKIKDLDPKRDYIYISDLVEAIAATLRMKDPFLVLNLGSGYSLSVAEVIAQIKKVSGIDKKIINANEKRMNEIPDTVADIKLAKQKLGWEPKVTFEQGIKQMMPNK